MGESRAAELYWAVMGAGVIQRLDLLDEALEQARRDGAATALESLLGECDPFGDLAMDRDTLAQRVEQYRAGLQ